MLSHRRFDANPQNPAHPDWLPSHPRILTRQTNFTDHTSVTYHQPHNIRHHAQSSHSQSPHGQVARCGGKTGPALLERRRAAEKRRLI
jgi:hypothetical protein